MYAFVANTRPRSVQARRTAFYKSEIANAFQRYVPDARQLDGPLYGVVYYFHNVRNDTDADNISKPVWDSLEGIAFENDRAIQLRIAGVRDLTSTGIETMDLSGISPAVAADRRTSIGNEDHVLYVEVGKLDDSMYRFGCEGG